MEPAGNEALRSILDDPPTASAIVHYYRATMARSIAWRNIVDNTINWAVAAAAAMISFGFSGTGNRHVILLVAHLFILMFLLIEARRYSYYTLIDWRVRLMERELFANLLAGREEAGTGTWRQRLAEDLRRPRRPISLWSAFALRLRRTYIWILLIFSLAWIVRVATYPATIGSREQLWRQSGLAFIPGSVLWAALAALYIFLIAAIRRGAATRERLEDEGFSSG